MHFSTLLSLAALAATVAASNSTSTTATSTSSASSSASSSTSTSSSGSGLKVVVKNQCGYDLTVSKLTNGQSSGQSASVPQGSSKTYPVDETWEGRFWARTECSGNDCQIAGASDPASLAEFRFRGSGGEDYYDISFVDGFNLPISITPISGQGSCGSPTCSTLPSCPDDMKITANGQFSSCQSACSKYNTDEYCCTGAFDSTSACSASSYSKAVKDDCPNAYSYAYDDATSTYSCTAEGYNVIFCP